MDNGRPQVLKLVSHVQRTYKILEALDANK